MPLLHLCASYDTLWGDLYLYNKMKLETLPNQMVQDALGSISGWKDYPEDFRGFPQSPQINGHNRFLQHPSDLSNGKDIQTRVDINGTKKKLPPRSRWELHSSGLLCSVWCYLPTFRDNISVTSSKVRNPWILTLEGTIDKRCVIARRNAVLI